MNIGNMPPSAAICPEKPTLKRIRKKHKAILEEVAEVRSRPPVEADHKGLTGLS
jgi:hypothetical protein